MKEANPSFKPYEGKDPYIFASYAYKESKIVIKDLELLNRLGFRIWYDLGIIPGKKWETEIEEHIKGCSVFMIFVSKKSLKSDNVYAELQVAKKVRGKKPTCLIILSIILDNDINDTDLSYNFLVSLECIYRWKYSQDKIEKEYYPVLINSLEDIAGSAREDKLDRDSKTLGIGYLPTLKDVLCEQKTSLAPDEQEERRNGVVLKMRKTNLPITSYSIDNMFQITSEVTHALHNLGELKLFETSLIKPTNLLTLPLHIGQVYIAPLRLVTGLITRLDENWPPLVASYSILVKQHQMNRLDDLHYYIEFCWLAWGPSVLTTSLSDDNQDFMVVQAAFGDEANSLPLIMKKDKWALLGIPDNGRPVCLENVLVVRPGADDFFKPIRNHDLFQDIFSDLKQVALYLPHEDIKDADGKSVDGEVKALIETHESFYSTAYVWLMLEQIEQDEIESEGIRHGAMEPGKVIPFFEHANLATRKGLDFLQHCLARKAIYHVLDCESDPDYRDKGYYCFATALFPDQMVKILGTEISRLNAKDQDTLNKRFKIPKNPEYWRKPVEVVKFADAVEKAIAGCCKELIEKSGDCDKCDPCRLEKKHQAEEP